MRACRTKESRERFAHCLIRHNGRQTRHIGSFGGIHSIRACKFKQIDHADPTIYSARVGAHYRVVESRKADDLIVWFWIGSYAEFDKLG